MNQQLIDLFDDSQRRSIALMAELLGRLESGMTARAVSGLAAELLPRHGFDRWFYPPEIQIGAGTLRTGVWRPPSRRQRLRPGVAVMLALGPSDGRSCGDIGTSIVFGEPDNELVHLARRCTVATCGYASSLKCVGELFIYASTWAANHRLTLTSPRSIGHALLPATGRLERGYPRSAHAATWLRRHQIHFLNPRRLDAMWAIGPQLSDGRAGARFRELMLITDGTQRPLGRRSLDELGLF
jgi:hypothetical protein